MWFRHEQSIEMNKYKSEMSNWIKMKRLQILHFLVVDKIVCTVTPFSDVDKNAVVRLLFIVCLICAIF
jgi:hypothetical protein